MAGEPAAPADAGTEPKARVFISYSRKNLLVAEALLVDLRQAGFEPFLDKNDIAPGEPWRERLHSLLVAADTVVFLISPDSIASPVCDWEVNEAERLAKRILPVVVQDVSDELVPGRLKRLNYVFLRAGDDRAVGLSQLGDALRTDIDWIREHTRISELAIRWRDAAQLLRGEDIGAAEAWASRRPMSAPPLSPTVLGFIAASRAEQEAEQVRERLRQRREVRRNRIIAWGSLAATVVVSLLGWFFLQSAQQALRSQSLFLSDLAQQQARDGDGITGILLALEGLRDDTSADLTKRFRPYVTQAEFALDRSLRAAREQFVFRGHTSPVSGAAFSPDGTRVLTAAQEDTAIVWNPDDGEVLLKLSGHTKGIYTAVFSADGSRILTASPDGTARIWNAENGEAVATLKVNELMRAAFSPDGREIVAVSLDYTARVIDIATGATRLTLSHARIVNSAVFSPDGTQILTASSEDPPRGLAVLRLWDARTGALARTIEPKRDMFHAAAFSPDGRRIIAGGVDHVARIFDAATGAEVLSLEGHADQIHGVAFSADGTRVVTTSADNTARVWDAAKGQHLATLRGHEFWVLNAAFSPDGNQVLTVAADKTARIWNLDTDSGEVMAFAPLSAAARNQGVSLSADGRQVFAPASGGFDVWNVQSSQLAETLDCLLCGRVRFSDPAKTRIVVLTPEGEIKDLKSGEKLGQVEGSFNGHEALLTGGGDRLMVRTKQDTETIYDIKSGKVLVQLTHACAAPTPGCGIWTAAFSQDGTRVVTSTNHRVVRVWDAASGKELFQKSVPGDPRSVTFSPDGKQLLVVNHGDVLLWDARNGAPLGTFSGHQNQVYSAAFNREGTRVVTTSVDRTIRIWDVATVTELYRIDVDTIGMMYADFSLDGTRIITTSLNTGAQLWRIPASTEKIIARAKERVTRCLTARQREVFHLTPDPPAWCRELKKWPYD